MISHSTNQHMRGRKLELEAEPEPEPDYFQDMTPDVKKPAKVIRFVVVVVLFLILFFFFFGFVLFS